MPRYTARLSSSSDDVEAVYVPVTAGDAGAAQRIAERQLEFRRRFAYRGDRFDTWAVLYNHLHGGESRVIRTGRIGEQ